ncbi:protein O-linked-mannose beta-1,4-N-acetylglucosaminyltransferase 2 isoform X1 [Galendromus occidentalis]|uniref:Protein O-linked-mannose beta-1,4-N-acetylglucosaminyltransferase 2 isoform X1 n=1 Tax=Galendromus occidentalis TaxID=34638 RepID=A0AAJ7L6V8_9ACAR|nr:protein O-linked-mannose beta-1,4-N-acetylglucosaminyltransferase 2 isoform X1 [Galendromus occidentalis]
MSFMILLTLCMGNPASAGSSAICGKGPIRDFNDFGTTYTDNHCVLHDVCWHHNGILFNLSDSRNAGPWPVLVSGSSVPDHDGMIVDITPVQKQTLRIILASSNIVFTESAVLLRSFLPDNLFHVLHDDILPTFAMKESLPRLNLTLFLTKSDIDRFDDYYSLLHLPIVYAKRGEIRCFRRLFVGLPKTTLWYQYGFRSPQCILGGSDVSIIQKFAAESALQESKLYILRRCTILIRRSNRRILNLREIGNFLETEFDCSVEMLSLEEGLANLRYKLSLTDILISMHGAELSLSFFVPANAIVIELFPYAINSANYTPYKKLCELLDLIYEPWENRVEANTMAYPEKWLSALSSEEQLEIRKAKIVKEHLCCTNPAWLYRIYQDTKVDVDSLHKILQRAIARRNLRLRCRSDNFAEMLEVHRARIQDRMESSSTENWRSFWTFLTRTEPKCGPTFHLGRVRDIRCVRSAGDARVVTWRAPINQVDDLDIENSYFEVVSRCGSEVLMTRTRQTSFTSSPCNESMDVWVQAHGGIKAMYPVTC